MARSFDVGGLVQIKQAWDNSVTNLFSGSAPVTDLQTLLSRLGVNGGSYNTTTKQLTFPINIAASMSKLSMALDFGSQTRTVGQLSSANLADLQADARLNFTLGVDLSSSIGSSFNLSDSTLLTTLWGPDGTTVVTYDHDQNSSTAEVPRWTLADRAGQIDSVRFKLSDGTTFDASLDGTDYCRCCTDCN